MLRKKLLFTYFFIFSITLSISQNKVATTTDENGKISFIKTSNNDYKSLENETTNLNALFTLDWSNDDFNISNHPAVDSWNPRLDVGDNGTIYTVYNDNHTNGLQKIMFRKKEVEGEWSNTIFVDTGGEIGSRNNHFPAIAVSQNNDVHVVYNVWAYENARNYIGYSYYNSSTETWSDGVELSEAGGSVNHTISHHDIYTTNENLPVVLWGYDFRENLVNEEVYIKYFDGANWSSDIIVSTPSDGLNAYKPYIKSIGNNKAMIIFMEDINASEKELRYRIYDETTHELSNISTIPTVSTDFLKYDLVKNENGDILISTIHNLSNPWRDVFNIIIYDESTDTFTLSEFSYEHAAIGPNSLSAAIDCYSDEDCAIVYTDYWNEQNVYMEFSLASGYGETLVINEQNPSIDNIINCKFDLYGNLHVLWNDLRFDTGGGYIEREVFYEVGINEDLHINDINFSEIKIYPNPSNGTFFINSNLSSYTIEVLDILGRLIQTTKATGNTTIHLTTSGFYYFRFNNNEINFVKKVMVK